MAPRKAPQQPTHADLRHDLDMHALVLQRIEKSVEKGFEAIGNELSDLKRTVGEVGTDERGALIGTGIAGELGRLKARVDARFGIYDRWASRVMGAVSAVVILGVAIWWLVEDRLAEMFR